MLGDYLIQLIRTTVPIGVGSVLAWAGLHFGIILDADSSTKVKIAAVAVTIAVYYAAAAAIERRWPALGHWLIAAHLTRAQPPRYRVELKPTQSTRIGLVRRTSRPHPLRSPRGPDRH
jgi:hypothetical protein